MHKILPETETFQKVASFQDWVHQILPYILLQPPFVFGATLLAAY